MRRCPWLRLRRRIASLSASLLLLFFASASRCWAQNKKSCPDGDHYEIDVKQVALQYDVSSFAGTLSALSVLGARLEVAPKKLQEASAATQQWDVFVKGLAAGYNSCAITRQQYADGLNRIYPRLKEDAAGLEEIRKAIAEGKKADEQHLQSLLDSYYANLRQFAQASGKEIILERIEALSEQVASGQTQILQQIAAINAKLDEFNQKTAQSPPPTPREVSSEISELRKNLLAKADEAEAAYEKGYELLDRYHFREALPYLEQAATAVQLPDFYLTLGRAYEGLPDLPRAETALRAGLALIAGKGDEKHEALLDIELAAVLGSQADLDGALKSARRALEIDEKVYGPSDSRVAIDADEIGTILSNKADFEGALKSAQQALEINEKVYGSDHPSVARDARSLGVILLGKGDLGDALKYTLQALKIDEKVYGPDHPDVAADDKNIGLITRARGNLEAALSYTLKALKIDERFYGPDYPNVATDCNNLGLILMDRGNLDAALSYAQRALKIDEAAYGPDNPHVALHAGVIAVILQAKGDLDGALSSAQQALKIDEKLLGPDHPFVARDANNIGSILSQKKDRDGAISYFQKALKIDEKLHDDNSVVRDATNVASILYDKQDLDGALIYARQALSVKEKVYGPDDPRVAIDVYGIGHILKAKGDLDDALSSTQRALKIYTDHYGPNNPSTKNVAAALKEIEQTKEAKHH